jgi:Arc/MetJ-type ribon-helix-helix transcriptional regulator
MQSNKILLQKPETYKLCVNVPVQTMRVIDNLVASGKYMNRTEFTREALAEKLGREE